MREGPSGFWLTTNDGAISIGYVDFGVGEFGGLDFEKTYYMNKANSEKFINALKKKYSGTLEEMVEAAFGRGFRDPDFWQFCKDNDIEYSSSTWTS